MVLSVIVLLLLLVGLVRLPSVQQKIVHKAESILEDSIGTEVSIGHLYLSFPKALDVRELYMEDQNGDTLVYFDELKIDTDLWALFSKTIELNSIELTDLTGNVRRYEDSTFNFTYIIEAFDTGTPPQPTSEPWQFSIEDLELTDIRLDYQDALTSGDLHLDLNSLEVVFDQVNPTESIFHIASISLSDTDFRYVIEELSAPTASSQPSSSDTSAMSFDLLVEQVKIRNSGFFYKTPHQLFDISLGTFELSVNEMNVMENRYDLENFLLEGSKATIQLAAADSASIAGDTVTTVTTPMDIALEELSMADNEINYVLGNPDSTLRGFNPNLVTLRELSAELSDLRYTPLTANATVSSLSFSDPGKFELKEAGVDFSLTETSLEISNLHLLTANSDINAHLQATFSSLENLMQPTTSVRLVTKDTRVGPKDLLYFSPQLNENAAFDLSALEDLRLTANVDGSLEQLDVRELQMNLGATSLQMNGTLGNLSRPDSVTLDIRQQLASSRKALRSLLPDSLYPSGINVPERFQLKGTIAGAIHDLQVDLDLTSSLGDFHLEGTYAMGADSVPRYDATIKTPGFELGALMGQPKQFGLLALDMSADGKGATLEAIDVQLKGTISRFDFQEYTYNDLSINGRLLEGMFEGHMEMEDENLKFSLDGNVDQMAQLKDYRIRLEVEKADLHALNFSKNPLTIAATIETDIRTEDFQRFNGDVTIRDFSADNEIGTYRVDSLLFSSIDQDSNTEITIESDLMDGEFTGNVDLFSLAQTLTNHVNYYYTLQDTVILDTLKHQQFQLSLDLKKTELFTELLFPQLETFDPGKLEVDFNSAERVLNVNLDIKELNYNGIEINTLLLFVKSNPQYLFAGIHIDDLSSQSMAIPYLELTADVEQDLFDTRLVIRDSVNEKKYLVKGAFQSGDGAYRFSLDPDSLLLAYDLWEVSEGNLLRFGPAGFAADDFILSRDAQKIAVQTRQDSTHRISFERFQLNTISNAIGKEDSLLTGMLNGFVNLEPVDTTFGFTAELTIDDMAYLKEQLGTLQLNAQRSAGEAYQVNLTSTGANKMTLEGEYFPVQTEQTHFTLDLTHVNLAAIAGLAAGSVEELYGTLTGKLTIEGSFTDPDLNGRLHLAEAGISPTAIGTLLKMDDQTIAVENSTLRFNRFRMTDKDGNTATLNGEVAMEDATYYRFDLKFVANDFLILNSDSEDNELYYGKLIVDADADITGTSARPDVDLTVEVKEESNVSYVIPESEYTALDQSNVVVFKGPPGSDSLKTRTKAMDSLAHEFQGIHLTTNLDINEEATFNIIIDPLTGDQLTVQGSANLTVNMNRQGELQLSGRYEINSGTYNFSFYKLVNREFNITQGSTITWTGDPMEANMNIQASHRVETSPLELLNISNTTSPDYNQYRQQLPFLVYLNIDGKLIEPEISFELDMPQAERNAFGGAVYGRLQDINSRESDLNKQVFALLILKRFISDDPFSNDGGASLADNTRRSVSRIMTDQLNRLAENVKGVDITFDLQSYQNYSAEGSENRTQLEVGLSKELFSDRVVVKVTGNVNVEGGEGQNTATDYIGDLVLEYKITEDGRLRVSAFRRTDFDVINGQIIETGSGLIYVREYDALKELFNFDESTKE